MKDDQRIYDHVFATYISLRKGMAVIAFAFPIVVPVVGYLLDKHLGLQDSLSAYYWASNTGFNPSRVPFVGGLFAIAAFLYLYKGFTVVENIVLNLAGVCAVGVACFPMNWTCDGCGKWTPHGLLAITLFGCLAYVVFFRSRDTLKYLPKGSKLAFFKWSYRVAAILMAGAPVGALLITMIIGRRWYVIFIEGLGIWAFAYYWLVKGCELNLSHATKKALSRELAVAPETKMEPTEVQALSASKQA